MPRGDVQVGGLAGTPGTGRGNSFAETAWANGSRLLEISGGFVQGNLFSAANDPAILAEGSVTIGGETAVLGNLIENVATGAPSPGPTEVDGAISLAASHNFVKNNVIANNGGYGAVQVVAGQGDTITDNSMSANPQGIVLGTSYVDDGERSPSSGGPNDYQPYPVLRSAESHASGTEISGLYEEPASFRLVHSITVDLYAMKVCNGAPQGEVYLGSRTLKVSLAQSEFNLKFNPLPAGPGYDSVTATATAPDGSTSEFSPCFTIGSHPDPFYKLGVAPTNTTVAVTTASSVVPAATTSAVMPGMGHSTLLLYCPASASKYCRGTFTLRTSGAGGKTIARGGFKTIPGYVHPVNLTVTGKLLAKLERKHKLRVQLTTKARDAAKRHNHKDRRITVTLSYK